MIPHDPQPDPSQPVVPGLVIIPAAAVAVGGVGTRRAPLHPAMEDYIAAVAPQGRPHLREHTARLRPLLTWCQMQHLDPVLVTAEDLGRFRRWLWEDWRGPDGEPPAYHTKRHTLGMVRAWYRWLVQAGRRVDDPAATVLSLRPEPGTPLPTARFVHTPLHPQMAAYLEHHRLRGRHGTARAIDIILRQFACWCRDQAIDPILLTRAQADAYRIWLSTTARTPRGALLARTTVAQRVSYISGWYDWLEVQGAIIGNPAGALRVRVVQSRLVLHQHLSMQEAIAVVQTQAQAVLAAQPGTITRAQRLRTLTAVCLALATGRRLHGLVHMRVADLDLDRQELRVASEKGKTGRVLPVAGWAVAVVREYLRDARPLLAATADVPWLLVRAGGETPMAKSALGAWLHKLIAATCAANPDLTELPGKTITWHSLRVSFATLLFANGCSIRSVNELMLHRSLATTARYTPIPIEDMQRIWRTAHPRP